MNKHFSLIGKEINNTREALLKDSVLQNDIDFSLDFIPPYSKADSVSDVRVVIIGQDPTVRRQESREKISYTLNLDKENSLRTYIKAICNGLHIDIDKHVYATNLYKCFFKIPPADDQTILTRQFKTWADLLMKELKVFENATVVTLGEPLINQLIHTNSKKVNHYWDYIGETKSGRNFKCIESSDNYLQRRIYPLAHQPTWSRNKFYKTYFNDYLEYIYLLANKQHK